MIRARLLAGAIAFTIFIAGYWLFVVHGVHVGVTP